MGHLERKRRDEFAAIGASEADRALNAMTAAHL